MVEGDGETVSCPGFKVEVQAEQPINREFSVANCSLYRDEYCLKSVSPVEGFRVSRLNCSSFKVTCFQSYMCYQNVHRLRA